MGRKFLQKPQTREDAINYACYYTSRHLTKAEIQARIEESRKALERETIEESKVYHNERLEELTALLEEEFFINGDYPQAIDTLLFDLIEWRAMFYALERVSTSANPFDEHLFFQQWKVGGAYAMYSQLSKLASQKKADFSLRKLWCDIREFIEQDVKTDEVKFISKELSLGSKRFSGSESKAMNFRHSVVAHNAKSMDADLEHLDNDIKLLARAWSIITTWSSFGLIEPWQDEKRVFSVFEHFYDYSDIISLKKCRREYLANVEQWCRTSITTAELDRRSPFGQISVSIQSSS